MEYSLYTLNKVANLESLTISEIIDRLNLIGFEVDEVFNEKLNTNKFIDNTRLLIKIPPNREDLLCEVNFLKELSTIFSFTLKNRLDPFKKRYQSILEQKYIETNKFEIKHVTSKVSRPITKEIYNGIKIFNIEIENFENFKCPLWIQDKLSNAGLKSNNTIDDIISLVNLEWGYSINCLNLNTTRPSQLFVEQLKDSYLYRDDSQNNHILTPGTIVLKNQNNEIQSVLGIFNTSTDISARSQKIPKKLVLEAIYYDIHKNELVLNPLNNKISLRYLRSMALINFKSTFERLLTLLELTSNTIVTSRVYSTPLAPGETIPAFKTLKLRKSLLQQTLNIDHIDLNIFKSAGLKLLSETPDELNFSISTQRNDLSREIDLIEEYSRFIGYKNFTPLVPNKVDKFLQSKTRTINFFKQLLLSNGFQEVITNPLQNDTKQDKNAILIYNPLNKDFSCLRLSLIYKLITLFENNLKLRNNKVKFFETGRVFQKNCNSNLNEIDKLGGIFQLGQIKRCNNPTIEWFKAKGFIENLLKHFGYTDITFEKTLELHNDLHPTKSVLIKSNNQVLGIFGEVNPEFTNFQILKFATYVFELNLTYFRTTRLNSPIPNFKVFSKYSNIIKDISFSIDKNTNFYKLKEDVQNNCVWLKNVEFFDLFYGDDELGVINAGLRLDFKSESSTFTNELIEQELNNIKKLLILNYAANFK